MKKEPWIFHDSIFYSIRLLLFSTTYGASESIGNLFIIGCLVNDISCFRFCRMMDCSSLDSYPLCPEGSAFTITIHETLFKMLVDTDSCCSKIQSAVIADIMGHHGIYRFIPGFRNNYDFVMTNFFMMDNFILLFPAVYMTGFVFIWNICFTCRRRRGGWIFLRWGWVAGLDNI